jgi:hypothetical protein
MSSLVFESSSTTSYYQVVRIDRRNDPYAISNKIFDFSCTLSDLRKSGYINDIYHLD